MKRTLLICFLALLASLLSAQKIYFIYLQTETGEPFFVRMNDKLYSSESSGYLILPRLKDSTYKFKLGFPSKDIDLDFTTSINKKDHGYLIKNLGDRGWGLFDLQSLDLQMSPSNVKKETGFDNNTNTQVNAFTALLAKATDDPSLRQNAVFAKEVEKKPAVVQTIEKEEKKPVVTDAVIKEEKKQDQVMQPAAKPDENKTDLVNISGQKEDSQKSSINQNQVYKRSDVIKLSESGSADGYESVYIDQNPDGTKDTIRVFIRADKTATAVKEEPKIDSAVETNNLNSSDTAQVMDKAKEEPKKEETKKWWSFPFIKGKTETTESKRCEAIANNDDFLKLRKKMAARTNDDGMLDEARKYFKSKCFATEQIKNLSTLFLSNAGKYNFFSAAYNYTTDVDNFSSLQSELKDEYYINRFKEMLHN